MEETIHDYDKMVAMSVIEAEIELMQDYIKKLKGPEKDLYNDKMNNLEFAKSTIESNIGIGILTPEKYI
jgi:hypothetical protein